MNLKMNKIADDSKLSTSLVNKTATEGFDVNTFENMLHDVYEEDSVDSEDFNTMSIVKKKKRSINMSAFGELSDNSDDSSDDSNDHEDAKSLDELYSDDEEIALSLRLLHNVLEDDDVEIQNFDDKLSRKASFVRMISLHLKKTQVFQN